MAEPDPKCPGRCLRQDNGDGRGRNRLRRGGVGNPIVNFARRRGDVGIGLGEITSKIAAAKGKPLPNEWGAQGLVLSTS